MGYTHKALYLSYSRGKLIRLISWNTPALGEILNGLSFLGCAHSWYLDMLHKLQKRICGTVGPSLAAPLERWVHPQNVAGLSLFHSYYFVRCSSELAELFLFPHSRGRSSYFNRLHDFSVTISGCYKISASTVSFFPQLDSGILCLENAFLWSMI